MKNFYAFMLLFSALLLSSQWNTDVTENLQVSSLKSSVDYTAQTSDGKTYVFFFEENSTDNYVPRLQLLDKDGNKLFGDDGMVVNTTVEFSTYITFSDIAVDQDDNAIVSFMGTNDGILYANKITPAGENVWGDSGISVVNGGAFPKIAGTPSGVIIGYTMSGKGYLMKYDNTTGAALWTSPIIFASPISGQTYTTVTELNPLSDGGFVGLMIAKGSSWGIYGSLVAQRYSADGTPVWDSPAVLTTATGVQYNTRYDHITDDEDNFYVGYFTDGINGSKFDAFVQRVSADGTLPWGNHGKEISSGSYNEMKTNIGLNGNDLWAVTTFKNSSQGSAGEYIQKFDKETGESAFGDAKELYPLSASGSGRQHISGVSFIDSVPVILTEDFADTSVTPIVLEVIALDSNGDIISENAVSGSTVKGDVYFTAQGDQGVAVWSDERDSSTPRIYAQNFKFADLAVQESGKVKISIYPNPAENEIHLSASEKINETKLFDVSGKLLLSSGQTTINISSLKPGIYILSTVLDTGKTVTTKLIKK